MALNTLTLSFNVGRPGYPFQAQVLGLTTGTVDIGEDATHGFSYANGILSHPKLPPDRETWVVALIERDAAAKASEETRLEIVAEEQALHLNRLRVAIPDYIESAGSALVTGAAAGSILTLATNPDEAWSIAGTKLSWSSAAAGNPGRPVIIETLEQTIVRTAQTILPRPFNVPAFSG